MMKMKTSEKEYLLSQIANVLSQLESLVSQLSSVQCQEESQAEDDVQCLQSAVRKFIMGYFGRFPVSTRALVLLQSTLPRFIR